MSALAAEPQPDQGNGWEDLVRRWESMDWPEGCKVEIIEGIITVAPTPSARHNSIAYRVLRRLTAVIPEDWGVYQTQSVSIPSRMSAFIPDLLVAPLAELDGPGHLIPATAGELVVEVTSPSNASTDRITKAAAYAEAGVPLYLLIDRHAPGGPTVTLYGEPKNAVYRVLRAVPFGEEIHLPAPFDLTLDTSEFPVS
ncbi:Uma2 family endonuclease [Streptomyces sp. CC208A]|uniref:Uma2 family endonuclease n=1 Tax=Streptomyces sp. CC208A TaxID=3044573 RepID=UPI0024A98538|nr:Uma2 family endonuclease [Streptomyces sp. CC208A]